MLDILKVEPLLQSTKNFTASPVNVTILMSIYKENENTIFSTLSSVLRQSYKHFVIIIIDDFPDRLNKLQFHKKLASSDCRVIIVNNQKNLGLTQSLIRGQQVSKSPLIARIDAGDFWHQDKLRRQVDVLSNHDEIVLVGTQCLFVDETSHQEIGRSSFPTKDDQIRSALKARRGVFVHPSIVFRSFLKYRDFFKYSQDLDLYLRAQDLGKLYCMPEYLTICVFSRQGITISQKHVQRKYINAAHDMYEGKELSYPHQCISINLYDRIAWSIASIFYSRYIHFKSSNSSIFTWGFYLLLTFVIYPPLGMDYAYRILLSLRFR